MEKSESKNYKGNPYNITNNFGEDSSCEFIAQWHNDIDKNEQVLQIVEASKDFTEAKEITAVKREFSSSGAAGNYPARNIFKAHVNGLTADTLYKYRMGNKDAWSQDFYFKTSGTAKKGVSAIKTSYISDFSFTVTADPQAGVFETMKETLLMAEDFDKDNRFFINAGDLVEQIGLHPQEIVNYTEAANTINRYKPIAATQGNHDNYDTSGKYDFIYDEAGIFNAFVTFPQNGWNPNEINKSQSYFFYYNDVLFIMLNTMISIEKQHKEQADWLKKVLQKNNAKYIIVCMHTGLFGNHYYEDYYVTEFRKAYGKIFTDYKVDIVFSGHDHTYARTNPIKIGTDTSLDTINLNETPGGTIYSIVGSCGLKYYDEAGDIDLAKANEIFVKRTRTIADIQPGMFVNVKVTSGCLTVTACRKDGYVLDTYKVAAKRYKFMEKHNE